MTSDAQVSLCSAVIANLAVVIAVYCGGNREGICTPVIPVNLFYTVHIAFDLRVHRDYSLYAVHVLYVCVC